MNSNPKDEASRGRETNKQRRRLLKLAALGGATAIASPWTFQSTRSAPRLVKIGMVSPETGPIAAFGEADQFVLAGVRKAIGDGIIIAGEKHPVQIIYKDSQSNPNRAAEVTAQLINNDKVDLVIGSSTSDTVIPVSDQCELAGVPCVTSDDPWQIWFFGRKGDPKKGFEWTYHFFWGLDQLGDIFADMWLSMPSTNRVLGTLWSNEGDGVNANAHLPDFFKSKGFEVHNLGLYNNNADDFSAQIADLKKLNCEIVSGVFTPPEFGIFLDPVRSTGLPAQDRDPR
jgi:branched-chain amino acid transport system substrate-binding protein